MPSFVWLPEAVVSPFEIIEPTFEAGLISKFAMELVYAVGLFYIEGNPSNNDLSFDLSFQSVSNRPSSLLLQ